MEGRYAPSAGASLAAGFAGSGLPSSDPAAGQRLAGLVGRDLPGHRLGPDGLGLDIAEPLGALGPQRLAEFHRGEYGGPLVVAVPDAQIAVMQLNLGQPPGQQLAGGEA